MKKGSIILNQQMTTQLGNITARKGAKLVSVFLGSVENGTDPDPARRMESLGWRQMAMYECSVRVSVGVEDFEWRLAYSCLGAVDAVEAAVRFGNKMCLDEFNRATEGTPPPLLTSVAVGTIKIGPVADDGTPFNGRGPAFFGWKHDLGTSLEDHLEALRAQAKRHAL